MTSVFYALIILPILFMTILSFIFSSSVSQLKVQQLKLNCPYPVFSGHVIVDNITSNYVVNYHIDNYNSTYANWVTVFDCFFDNNSNPSANTRTYEPTSGFFSAFNNAFAYMGYMYTSTTAFLGKAVAIVTMLYLLVQAPTQVTGLAFFTYVNIILLFFIALGLFMVVRG